MRSSASWRCYLLADYDDLARKLILAHHTALIDRSTLERWLNDGAHALRSPVFLAQQYRYSGTTRDDFAAKNAAARAALEKIRRAAAGRAGRHAPLALRATHRAAGSRVEAPATRCFGVRPTSRLAQRPKSGQRVARRKA